MKGLKCDLDSNAKMHPTRPKQNRPTHAVFHQIQSRLIIIPVMNPFFQIWGAVGPLVGLFVGWLLTRSWQRKQWILEGKKSEYRELLSTLSRSARCIMANSPGLWGEGFVVEPSEREKQRIQDADTEARCTIEDRIFIHNMIQNESVLERWQLIIGEKQINRFLEYWKALHKTLVDAAHKDLGINGS